MIYDITHTTQYEYGDTVPECFNIVRLYPRPIFDQACQTHQLEIEPQPRELVLRKDFFGNLVEQFSIDFPHGNLKVVSRNSVSVTSRKYPDFETTPAWETIANADLGSDLLASQLRWNSPHVRKSRALADYSLVSFTKDRPIAVAAVDLTRRIFEDFAFDPQATTVSTPVEEVFNNRKGVCQDFAHLQIACLRSLNLPARYVSGYLRTEPPPGQQRLIGADASHAWVSLYCGPDSWFDFDPTNNLVPETDHISIAWGRDYADVCPIQGVFTGGGNTLMRVSVDVAPRAGTN